MKKMKFCAAAAIGTLLCAAMPITASAAETKAGWQVENGRRYYYQDGAPLTGEQEIDGVPYLFAPNGVQQKGWQTVGGKRYCYDKDGTALFGWVTWRGETYYVTKDDGKLTGDFKPEDSSLSYIFDDYGVMEHRWTQDADGTWYYTGCSGEVQIGGIPYLLDENGKLLSGWQTASDGNDRYYDAETHKVRTGWLEQDGARVYVNPVSSLKMTGYREIDGEHYYFDAETGAVLTGIQQVGATARYFRDPDGAEQYGLMIFEIGACYFDKAQGRVVGFYDEDGAVRFFDLNGIMQHGMIGFPEGFRYFDDDGIMVYGKKTIDGKNYDFGTDGIAITGWGTLADGGKCWYGADGVRVTGWQEIDGKSYYFDENGKLSMSGVVKGVDGKIYVFNADGTPATGWQTYNGKTYHCNDKGIADTDWQEIDGYGYYFDENGVMAVSKTIGDYTIDEKGHARSSLAVRADNLLAKYTQGWPMSIYTFCVNNYRYSRIEATRTYEQLSKQGWDKLAKYTMDNYSGVCYYLAATMDYFLHRKGYTCRMVHATHDTGNHYWNQVLIDGVWQNYDPTYNNRGNITWADQIARGNYIILGYVTTHYDARGTYTGDTYVAYTG